MLLRAWRSWLVLIGVILCWPAAAFAGPMVVNEVVTDPQTDWNTSGSITQADEYIELRNVTNGPISLVGWQLSMNDSMDIIDCFGNATPPCTLAASYRVFDDTGFETGSLASVPAFGYVLISDPGDQLNNMITLTLTDNTAAVSDVATIADGNADSVLDETISRFPDGTDTDSSADFAPLRATRGESNGDFCAVAAGDLLVNEVVTAPLQNFDGVGGVDDGDEYVEIRNQTGGDLDIVGCVVEMNDSTPRQLVLQDVAAPAAPFVRVFGPFDNEQIPADLHNVPSHGYVVIVDPPGAINNAVTVRVRNDADIDLVAITGGSSNAGNESSSRFSDGDALASFVPLAASLGHSNGNLCSMGAGGLAINEVVSDPFQNWDHDGAPGAFDGTALAGGTVDSDDEYIELHNLGNTLLSLVGCVVEMNDSSSALMVLQTVDVPADPYVRVFDQQGVLQGVGLVEVPAYGYVLIGNPPGTMNNSLSVVLRGDTGALDQADVNGTSAADLDEAASRLPDGSDTDSANDFAAILATPGKSNGACGAGAVELVINEVVGDAQQDWSHTSGGTPFDGTPGTGTIDAGDEYIELRFEDMMAEAGDLRGCIIDIADTTAEVFVLQGQDALADPYVRVFDDMGAFVGNADALSAVPSGGYVLIGDPPGTTNNAAIVSVRSATAYDTVDFGGDAADLDATSVTDEAPSRLPDGADSDVSATDFRAQPATPGKNNELDDCTLALDDCDALASCTDTAAGWDCACNPGYAGDGVTCTDVNECQMGSDDCDPNAVCNNVPGSFGCTCLSGYSGDGTTCTDVDECAGESDNCDPLASCTNSDGGFDCVCPAGYDGDGVTCTDIDECNDQTDDCDDNAECRNNAASFECACKKGYSGDGRTCTPDPPDGTDEVEQNSVDERGCDCRAAGVGTSSSAPLTWLMGLLACVCVRRRRGPSCSLSTEPRRRRGRNQRADVVGVRVRGRARSRP